MLTAKVFYPTRILSSANASDLIGWINDNVERGSKKLLINLQNVLFMDSTGLAALVTALKIVKGAGGRLALCALNGQARMLFEMANMDQMFEIYASPLEFEASIEAPASLPR